MFAVRRFSDAVRAYAPWYSKQATKGYGRICCDLRFFSDSLLEAGYQNVDEHIARMRVPAFLVVWVRSATFCITFP